jgi:hypothetical protein
MRIAWHLKKLFVGGNWIELAEDSQVAIMLSQRGAFGDRKVSVRQENGRSVLNANAAHASSSLPSTILFVNLLFYTPPTDYERILFASLKPSHT